MLAEDERRAAFCPVECGRCGAGVLAAKFSPQHTSVQWSAEAVRACSEFSAAVTLGRPSALVQGCGSLRAALGERTALIDGCTSLRDSIEAAISDGRLAVAPP